MNKNKLKSYAPQARRDFITAVSARAALLGLPPDEKTRVEVSGDVAIINGQAYPRNIATLRERLLQRITTEGWDRFVEEIAYTWFNRFTALRFMELNGFLPHGLRVLSNPDESKDEPEILEKAHTVDLPGLERERVVELKLAVNKESELYRLLLVAQCNQLHAAMPFLFERINDETELLLPDNLLHSDSVIRKLVSEIEEEDWQQIEIIGWLYQFYISERKDEVIGKVVKSEDIPAATQLFTPNWIVKYMTQNSLGRMWLQTYPDSSLRAKMEYYIEPGEQSPEVKEELAKLTPASINPEEIKILDPACGSGHILVEAYDLLKEVYRERGYSSRDIPRLILEKNLYGLDIDERAAQLASFALLMKARADERRVMGDNAPRLNIIAIPESSHLNTKELAAAILTKREPTRAVLIRGEAALFADAQSQPSLTMAAEPRTETHDESEEVTRDEVAKLLELFQQGKTFGSLIEIPAEMRSTVTALERVITGKLASPDLMERTAAEQVTPFVNAASMLAREYDCVIANPPYLGNKYFSNDLTRFAKKQFPNSKSDLFAIFIERCFALTKSSGVLGFMSPFVWMFLKSYEHLRRSMIEEKSVLSLVQPEYHAFFDSAYVPICSFVLANRRMRVKGEFFDLSRFYGAELQPTKLLEAIQSPTSDWRFSVFSDEFKKIPGCPIAYKSSDRIREIFSTSIQLKEIAEPRTGLSTSDNNRFVRSWYEVNINRVGYGFQDKQSAHSSNLKWYPFNSGGAFRKWYGNNEQLICFDQSSYNLLKTLGNHCPSEQFYFKPSITWSAISSSYFGVRRSDSGFIFSNAGSCAFPNEERMNLITGFLCSNLVAQLLNTLNPTLNILPGNISSLPILETEVEQIKSRVNGGVEEAVAIARADWDSFETSWDFQGFSFVRDDLRGATLAESFANWERHCKVNIKRMQELETENNHLFIEAYSLQDELSPEVPEEQITLAHADAATDTHRLVSYVVGCMMGRYSLDEPGLIYANSDGADFDPSRYGTFAADADGIIPVTDLEWFDDDAASRLSEFVRRAWGDDTYRQNLAWIAAQLIARLGEMPVETIRRYFSAQFFKDHLQTYKKRPIYWLFSSGKQKAFECLVYLHRYNESTLSRMRNEYVTPLFGKFSARIEYMGGDTGDGGLIGSAGSTAEKNRLRKQLEALKKKQAELVAFDDQLRHYADMRIKLDLDDGVKVNYGKFGNLLAEVRAVTGGSAE